MGGSFGGELPSVVGGVTPADCKTGSAATDGGSRGDDVMLPVTPADCKTGSAAIAGGSRGDDVTLPGAPRRVIAADCETGSGAVESRGSDPTVAGARILGKTTDGPVAATTPSAVCGAFEISV